MRSIKPGRGPSFGNAIGAVGAAIFGVFWMIMTSRIGAPGFFVAFGLIFVVVAIGQAVYHFHNATSQNRFSTFDITEDGEESDPLDPVRGQRPVARRVGEPKPRFCPGCGTALQADYEFCPQCGRDI